MIKRIVALSSCIACSMAAVALPANSAPERLNFVYRQDYTYKFGNSEDVQGCILRATAALAKAGIGEFINNHIADKNYGVVYGWNSDGTETAEVSCDKENNETILIYANYSSSDKKAYARWEELKRARW